MPKWSESYPPHPAAEVFPMLEGAERDALVADIREHGVREPVALWRDPESGTTYTLDGRNRFECAELAGMELLEVPTRVFYADGEPSEGVQSYGFSYRPKREVCRDPIAYVLSANAYRRHLTPQQKRAAVNRLLALDPNRSDRQIAAAAGVSHPFVGNIRREQEASGDVEAVSTRTDTLGRQQPVRRMQVRVKQPPQEVTRMQVRVKRAEAEQPSEPRVYLLRRDRELRLRERRRGIFEPTIARGIVEQLETAAAQIREARLTPEELQEIAVAFADLRTAIRLKSSGTPTATTNQHQPEEEHEHDL